jgi:AraC-like DNA-binding protein
MRHITIMSWQKGVYSPQIDSLLLMCRLLGISPLRFFCERSPLTSFAPVRKGSKERPITLREKRTALSSDELRLALEAVLVSEEEPPPSINEVAKRLGYRDRVPLYKRFPELCHAITARHQKLDPNFRRLHKQRIRADELQQALEAALMGDEEPPPSVEEVAKRLGYRSSSILYNRFPGLCRAITSRHLEQYSIEHLQRELEAVLESADSFPSPDEVAQRLGCPGRMLREQFPELWSAITRRYIEPLDIVALRAALVNEIQSDEEPRSMREIARALGYPVHIYLRIFPDECREISARRQAYRKRNKELRMQAIQKEVLRAVLAIEAEKAYPSERRVMEYVDRFCVCPPLFQLEIIVPWKEILIKRGYRV